MANLTDINQLLLTVHEARESKCRIKTLLRQAFHVKWDGANSGSESTAMPLAALLDLVQELLLDLSLSRRTTHRGASMNVVDRHDGGQLRGLVEGLRIRYKLPSVSSVERGATGAPSENEPMLTLKSLSAEEAVLLVNLAMQAAQSVEQELDNLVTVTALSLREKMSTLNVSAEQLGVELQSVNADNAEFARVLAVPYFVTTRRSGPSNLLAHVLFSKPWLVAVDLSHCLLGDDFFSDEILPSVASLQHLRLLLLAGNALTNVVVPSLEKHLRHETMFPRLRVLRLEKNFLTDEDIQSIDAAMRARKGSTSAKEGTGDAIRVLHVEAPCMHGAVVCRSLLKFPVDTDWTNFADEVDVFSGVSFSAVTAAAFGMKKSPHQVDAFFEAVATRVLGTPPMTSVASSATRTIREWWSGGDFYSMECFKAEVERLLGHEESQLTLEAYAAKFGVHLILHAEAPWGRSCRQVVFRSWRVESNSWLLPDATGKLNGSLNVKLVDALLACCATPRLFAKRSVGCAVGIRDSLCAPFDVAVCEVLANTDVIRSGINGLSSAAVTIDVTVLAAGTDPMISKHDCFGPEVLKSIALSLKTAAEQKLEGFYFQRANWKSICRATSMWSDVNLVLNLSSLRRWAKSTSTDSRLKISPSQSCCSVRVFTALQRQNSQLLGTIGLDESQFRKIADLDQSVSPPW